MNENVAINMIHEDIEILKRDVAEIKAILLEPSIRKEIVEKIKEARERMKKNYVSNDEIRKEFGV